MRNTSSRSEHNKRAFRQVVRLDSGAYREKKQCVNSVSLNSVPSFGRKSLCLDASGVRLVLQVHSSENSL